MARSSSCMPTTVRIWWRHISFSYKSAMDMFSAIHHSTPTGARNSSLGHPNMAAASHGKHIHTAISSLLHVSNGWYLQGLIILCVSLSGPQNLLCKRWNMAKRGGNISARDARISTRGCPKLPHLKKPGCPKLKIDARNSAKMPESCLTIRISYTNSISILFYF